MATRSDRNGSMSDSSDPQSDRVDQADRVKPWTIKGIPPEARNTAIAAAEREGQTVGEWMTRATRAQGQADRQANRAPVSVDRKRGFAALRQAA